jgi:hypothetical protein
LCKKKIRWRNRNGCRFEVSPERATKSCNNAQKLRQLALKFLETKSLSRFALLTAISFNCLLLPSIAKPPKSIEHKQKSSSTSEQTLDGLESKTKIEMISIGAEPRQILRYRPVINSKQTTKLSIKIDVESSMNGTPTPKNKIPDTTINYETIVNQVDANGDIHYSIKYTDANANGDFRLTTGLSKLKNTTGNIVIDSTGQVKSSQLDKQKDSDETSQYLLEQVTQSAKETSVHLPKVAVGNGAKWKVISNDHDEGVITKTTTTYELLKLRGNIATLNMLIDVQAPEQTIQPVGITPGNLKLPSKALNRKEKGQWTVNFNRLLPLSGTSTSLSQSKIDIDFPGAEKAMLGITTKMDIQIDSIP